MKQLIARIAVILISLGVLPGPVCAQKPVVNPGGIVNAATLAPGYGVARGALASVFGQNLASGTASAQSFPLPTTLGGTTVTFGGVPAPLIYVSPTQINLQVPVDAPFEWVDTDVPGQSFTVSQVVVTTSAGASEPQLVPLGGSGIFTLNASGCGRGAVFNVAPDGSVSLNGPDNSVEPGGILTLYGTGLAAFADPKLPDGLSAPASPPAHYRVRLFLILNARYFGSAYTMFAGAAPGYAGVDQFNIRLPDDAPEGCSVPLRVVSSQTIPISIRRGGGRCVDKPDSLAFLLWTRTVATGIDPPPPTDTLLIEFSSGVGKNTPAFPPRLRSGEYGTGFHPGSDVPYVGDVFPSGPACPASWEDRQLDAGTLTAQAPGLSHRIAPQTINGQPRYAATLPADTIRPGSYRITGEGGRDVGSFATALEVPEPIRLITQFPPGTVIQLADPPILIVRWEGGDPDSTVDVKIFNRTQFRQTSPAPNGLVKEIGAATVSGHVEIVVTQTVARAKIERFHAGGLTLGGWHVWSYEFRFGGVDIRVTFPRSQLRATGDERR